MVNYQELLEIYEKNPNNENAKEDLIFSLTQYLLENIHNTNNSEYKKSIRKLEKILENCDDDKYLYDKAAFAYIDNNSNHSIELFKNYIEWIINKNECSVYDNIAKDLIDFIDYVSTDYILKLSEKVEEISLPISKLILGMYYVYTEDTANSLMVFQKLMNEDANNWIASAISAEIYYEQKNWKPAIKCYEFALKTNSTEIGNTPDIFFSLAWCYGKIKDYQKESINYKKCLSLDKDYNMAMNNLGYSYIKQNKYQQALDIFDKCIKQEKDGKYPYSNKVRALKGLKRYREALKFIEERITDGTFTANSMSSDIEKLNRWIEQQENKNQNGISEIDIEEDLKFEIENSEPVETEETTKNIVKKKSNFATPNERVLEELIEQYILKDIVTFDRYLSMYEDDRYYGRQLIMPDVGRIDLLTVDNKSNDLIVIELKQGKGDESVINQITRYMGWLKDNLAKPNQNVIGIICVNEISQKLRNSVSVIPNIELYEYRLILNKM